MRKITLSCFLLIAFLSLLASCGGGGSGGGGDTSCTPNGNISLHSSSTGTAPLLGVTVTVTRFATAPAFTVFVRYTNPPVAAILAGYPPGATDPRTVGINITPVGLPTNNPTGFSLSFITSGATGTYDATWRFVAADAGAKVMGCQDLPVTFAIN